MLKKKKCLIDSLYLQKNAADSWGNYVSLKDDRDGSREQTDKWQNYDFSSLAWNGFLL